MARIGYNRNLLSHGFRGWKGKIKVLSAGVVSPEASFLGLQTLPSGQFSRGLVSVSAFLVSLSFLLMAAPVILGQDSTPLALSANIAHSKYQV